MDPAPSPQARRTDNLHIRDDIIHIMRPSDDIIAGLRRVHNNSPSDQEVSEMLCLKSIVDTLASTDVLQRAWFSSYRLDVNHFLDEFPLLVEKRIPTIIVHGDSSLREERRGGMDCEMHKKSWCKGCYDNWDSTVDCVRFHQRKAQPERREKPYLMSRKGVEDCINEAYNAMLDDKEKEEMIKVLEERYGVNLHEFGFKTEVPAHIDIRFIPTDAGTHHSKFAILYLKCGGVRIVITTRNFCKGASLDMGWTQYFPPKTFHSSRIPDKFGFEETLMDYLEGTLAETSIISTSCPFIQLLRRVDFSLAKGRLIVSRNGVFECGVREEEGDPDTNHIQYGFHRLAGELRKYRLSLDGEGQASLDASSVILQPTSIGGNLDDAYMSHIFDLLGADRDGSMEDHIRIVWPDTTEMDTALSKPKYDSDMLDAELTNQQTAKINNSTVSAGALWLKMQCMFQTSLLRETLYNLVRGKDDWKSSLCPHHKLYFATSHTTTTTTTTVDDDEGGNFTIPWLLLTSGCFSRGAMGDPGYVFGGGGGAVFKTDQQVAAQLRNCVKLKSGKTRLLTLDEAKHKYQMKKALRMRNYEMGILLLPAAGVVGVSGGVHSLSLSPSVAAKIPFTLHNMSEYWKTWDETFDGKPLVPYTNDPWNDNNAAYPWIGHPNFKSCNVPPSMAVDYRQKILGGNPLSVGGGAAVATGDDGDGDGDGDGKVLLPLFVNNENDEWWGNSQDNGYCSHDALVGEKRKRCATSDQTCTMSIDAHGIAQPASSLPAVAVDAVAEKEEMALDLDRSMACGLRIFEELIRDAIRNARMS